MRGMIRDNISGDLFADRRAIGDAGRDAGMQEALEHAEAVIDDWGERAYEFIVRYAQRGHQFTCPQVRDAASDAGFPLPPTAFAWGDPMRRAAKAGVIVRVGYTQYGDRTMHTQGVALWRASGASVA